MKTLLQYLFDHHTLSTEQAKSIFIEISKGVFSDEEITAFVSVFLMRNITLQELTGFQEALLELAVKVDLETDDLLDIVGTGGDGKNTFNISTLACFVAAGAGQKVAKHGNYGISSVSGSSNVLEELGVKFKSTSEELKADLKRAGICFLHAPLFHPALKTVGSLRRNLGIRTFFNILGPLVNPVQPHYSLIGVYHLEIARIYQYALQNQKEKFSLIHALDGYDEISLTHDTKIITENGIQILSPEDLGFQSIQPEKLACGENPSEAAILFKNILEGKGTYEQNAVVIANAAMALNTTGKFGDYKDSLKTAKDSLESGKALERFNLLIQA